jgi:hypothetical protein
LSTEVEFIEVIPSHDDRSSNRLGPPLCEAVYFSESDLPDAEAWLPVLEALARNLSRLKPKQDLVFWTYDWGNGEVVLGMTRPAGSKRQLKPLLSGSPYRFEVSGRGRLTNDALPVLKWLAIGGLVLFSPDGYRAVADLNLGGVPVVHRRYRIVGFSFNGEGSADEEATPGGERAEVDMRLTSIDLQNVKGFERFQATFSPSFTVVIGDNGRGKTTLLMLLKRVLAVWTPSERNAPPGKDFIRETLHVENGTPYRQPHEPWYLRVDGIGLDGAPLNHVENGDRHIVARVGAKILHREANENIRVPLPVVAYFSPWRDPPRTRQPSVVPAGVPRRLDGYAGALDLHADFNEFARWFKGFEMQWVVDGERVPALEAVRDAVIGCIPGCTSFRWVPKLDEIVATIDGTTHPIWRLSDGFRTMLALVGEIAWRAAVLNPALGAMVAKKVNGVVLIDEIDLHLHPRWQRRVVDDLRRAFPRIQFVATTHSPFVVQSMRAEEVINLDHLALMDYWREGIEDIAVEAMGLGSSPVPRSQIYRRFEEVSAQYMALVHQLKPDTIELESLLAELNRLQEDLNSNPAVSAVLRAQRLAREASK